MAVLNPEHLLEQAEKLIERPPAGPPRQVDVRRAISSAYYAVFHATMIAAADEYVGSVHRNTRRYALLYRRADHRGLRELAQDLVKSPLPQKYKRSFPVGIGSALADFASALIELQEKRHSADYDPLGRMKTSDAKVAIATARSAIHRLAAADVELRRMFISLMLFSPR